MLDEAPVVAWSNIRHCEIRIPTTRGSEQEMATLYVIRYTTFWR